MSCLIIDDILTSDSQGLIHADLMGFYEDYRRAKVDAGEAPLDARDWVIRTRSTVAMRRLEKLLGAGFRRSRDAPVPVLIDITAFPRPANLTDERLALLLELLRREENVAHLWERLGRLDNDADAAVTLLRTERRANQGHLWILKGNVAEIFSMPQQRTVLQAFKLANPDMADAVILSGVRIRRLDNSVSQFSDNLIVRQLGDGNLEVLMVFEVKSGYGGGGQGVEQVFDWTEGRITDGFRLEFPEGSRYYDISGEGIDAATTTGTLDHRLSYVYDPAGTTGEERVISLISADRQIITAQGQSQVGIDPTFNTGGGRSTRELLLTSEEMDYLCAHLLLERFGSP